MAKYIYIIDNGYSNCRIEDEIELDDSYLSQLSEEEKEKYIEDTIMEEVFNRIEWSYTLKNN